MNTFTAASIYNEKRTDQHKLQHVGGKLRRRRTTLDDRYKLLLNADVHPADNLTGVVEASQDKAYSA